MPAIQDDVSEKFPEVIKKAEMDSRNGCSKEGETRKKTINRSLCWVGFLTEGTSMMIRNNINSG